MAFDLKLWQELNRAVADGNIENVKRVIGLSPELVHATRQYGSILCAANFYF